MIRHILPEDWSDKLPFGRLTLRTLDSLCEGTGKGFISGGDHCLIFPDGRLKIKRGFKFIRPHYFLVSQNKMYVPCMVYSSLAEFYNVLPFRDFIWTHVRKKLFIRMLMIRKVNFMTIGYIDWKL